MHRPVRIRQHDTAGSGMACLSLLAAHYQLSPVRSTRYYPDGFTMLDLLQAAEASGFQVEWAKRSFRSLVALPKPFIAQLMLRNGPHYVVVQEATPVELRIVDPLDGQWQFRSSDEFRQTWTGISILLKPAAPPAPATLWFTRQWLPHPVSVE